ncbi:MAG: sulfite exporter TauE/SafE family protein [Acidobacteria bacterium]|nr:MAG: sulfite exporter TauE/SafE family protein [Acidobacteriota bacterium]
MVVGMLAILFVLMFAVATVFSMLGQGGGVLYTPIQVFFGIDFHVAATTSLFLIMTTSLSATLVFRKAKKVDWPLAIVLESATTLGGFVGGLGSGRFSGQFLSILFAGVVAFAAIFMVREFHMETVCGRVQEGWAYWRRQFGGQEYCVNLLVALPASFIAGAASGLVGVGGGILKVPLMVLLLGIPMDVAVGSSAFMVGMTAAGGFVGHVISGHWDWRVSLMLAVAVFIGGQIGARKSIGIDKKKMRRIFGWFLVIIATLMIIRAVT